MNPDEQAIRDVIKTWMTASAASDLSRLVGLMDEDVAFLTPGRPPMRGRDLFMDAQKSVLHNFHIEAESDVQEIQICGDWAYCWTHLAVTLTSIVAEKVTRRSGNTLSIFRKVAGKWVLYRDANMLA